MQEPSEVQDGLTLAAAAKRWGDVENVPDATQAAAAIADCERRIAEMEGRLAELSKPLNGPLGWSFGGFGQSLSLPPEVPPGTPFETSRLESLAASLIGRAGLERDVTRAGELRHQATAIRRWLQNTERRRQEIASRQEQARRRDEIAQLENEISGERDKMRQIFEEQASEIANARQLEMRRFVKHNLARPITKFIAIGEHYQRGRWERSGPVDWQSWLSLHSIDTAGEIVRFGAAGHHRVTRLRVYRAEDCVSLPEPSAAPPAEPSIAPPIESSLDKRPPPRPWSAEVDKDIEDAIRGLYAERKEDPPNVNEAWELVRKKLPGVTRRRVRPILARKEFASLRWPSGKPQQ